MSANWMTEALEGQKGRSFGPSLMTRTGLLFRNNYAGGIFAIAGTIGSRLSALIPVESRAVR